jgi:hypothetical protein
VVGLARSADMVPLLKARGINSVVGTLDDVDILTKAAQAADAVVHGLEQKRISHPVGGSFLPSALAAAARWTGVI